jgi:hypothetical protein
MEYQCTLSQMSGIAMEASSLKIDRVVALHAGLTSME